MFEVKHQQQKLHTLVPDMASGFCVGILFYNNIVVGFLLMAACPLLMKRRNNQKLVRQKEAFKTEFKDALQIVSAALEAGYSVENAWRDTLKELYLLYPPEAEIIKEFILMKHQMDNNKNMDEIMQEFSSRKEIEELESFAEVFITARKTGGDIVKITRAASDSIRWKMDAIQEIQTILAGKKYEAYFMKLVPALIIIYFRIFSPEYLQTFYNNLFGMIFMTVVLCFNVVAAIWADQIASIEV